MPVARPLRNNQSRAGVVGKATPEADLHDELQKQIKQKKFQKIEAQLKEAKAVCRELKEHYELGDLEAGVLLERKQYEARELEIQVEGERKCTL